MRKLIGLVVVGLSIASLAFAGSNEVKYEGGTLSLKSGATLRVDLSDPQAAVFSGKEGAVRVPWTGIQSIEYGQTASRRVVSSVLLLGPMGLFMKSRKHYVNVEWTDEAGVAQAAAFRADKNNFRAILSAFRSKSKVAVTCGDPEAAKYFACENSTELINATSKK